MATDEMKLVPKEIEDFTTELYNYIWTNEKITYPLTEKESTDRLNSTFDEPGKTSNFDVFIGNAVQCSQYFLREYCKYMFKCYGNDLIESDVLFCICVFDAIVCWIQFRDDVFVRIIDCAAIAAEAVLFCEAELKVPIQIHRASFVFKSFLTIFFQEELFMSGGWSGLSAAADRHYQSLHSELKYFAHLDAYPYFKLNSFCYIIKRLRDSPVSFPIPISMICTHCVEPSDDIHSGFDDSEKFLYRMLKDYIDRKCISNVGEIFLHIRELQRCLLVVLDDDSKLLFKSTSEETVTIDRTFLFVLVGNEEKEKTVDPM